MKKKMRTALSLVLALIMCLSLGMGAFAETVSGSVQVETTAGNNETVDVTITIESENNANGGVTTESVAEAEGFVTESGMTVDYSGSATEIKDAEGNLLPGSSSESEYTAVNADGSYVANGGSDSKVIENTLSGTVDVPVTEGGKDSFYGDAAGSSSEPVGDTDKSDGSYDYTTETVLQQGSITVETTELNVVVDKVDSDYESDLTYKVNETDATADNDLVDLNSKVQIPGEGDELPKAVDGYEFIYIGIDDTSQFWAAYLYTSPQLEGEVPIYTQYDEDGNVVEEYYIGRLGENGKPYAAPKSYYIEGIYLNGEKVNDDSTGARWDTVHSFILVDPATGKVTTTYCADQATPAEEGYGYNIENVEDASYYNEEQAAMIRTVALNGYWGTESGTGSLDSVKQMMREAKDAEGNAVFTEEEVNSLTDGMAMTATQYAIWSFSNAMSDVVFLNTQYTPKDENNFSDLSLIGDRSRPKENGTLWAWADFLLDVPESEQASVDLIFKLYNHLVNMEPTEITDPDSSNTIITKDNFIKDMSVTVIEKAEDHANNADAYVTELSFALVVTPSTENGDDMIVQVVGPDGVVAKARIAGEPLEGETMQYLTPDAEGNFIFSGITMTEGNQKFNITLQGIQNLTEGVYLYSSEIIDDVPSQTMVGIAGGAHAVNVSMDIRFNLNVEDEVVAVEHVWRTEYDPGNPPPEWNPPVPLNNEPEEEIIIEDEPVPLAQAPSTGGLSAVFAVAAAVSGMGLAGISLIGRRRDEE